MIPEKNIRMVLTSERGNLDQQEPGQEVTQRVTLEKDGTICLESFDYLGNRCRFVSHPCDIAPYLLLLISQFAAQYRQPPHPDPDVGQWELSLSDDSGKRRYWHGPMLPVVLGKHRVIVELLRREIGLTDLYLFDGVYVKDQIDRIDFRYTRKVIHTESHGSSETTITKERILMDRQRSLLLIVQNYPSGMVVRHSYQMEYAIAALLDQLDFAEMVSVGAGNPGDALIDPEDSRTYQISVTGSVSGKRNLQGTYDKNSTPIGWLAFLNAVLKLADYYRLGEVFQSEFVLLVPRRTSDVTIYGCAFEKYGKIYHYLADEGDEYEVGDEVLVPVGKDNRTTTARVMEVLYHQPEDAPYPLEKMKTILGLADDEDEELGWD